MACVDNGKWKPAHGSNGWRNLMNSYTVEDSLTFLTLYSSIVVHVRVGALTRGVITGSTRTLQACQLDVLGRFCQQGSSSEHNTDMHCFLEGGKKVLKVMPAWPLFTVITWRNGILSFDRLAGCVLIPYNILLWRRSGEKIYCNLHCQKNGQYNTLFYFLFSVAALNGWLG